MLEGKRLLAIGELTSQVTGEGHYIRTSASIYMQDLTSASDHVAANITMLFFASQAGSLGSWPSLLHGATSTR